MLNMFKQFMTDPSHQIMFITGSAGTGKTTNLHLVDKHCTETNINHHICAFTHKAVAVIKSKVSEDVSVSTLHSFLKKKPSINESAVRYHEVATSESFGSINPETELLIIDEFSMIEEAEIQGIQELIESTDFKLSKLLLIGDPCQLPPISGKMLQIPDNYKYHFQLTKVYRQADGNPLIDTLTGFSTMIKNKSYAMTPEVKELFKPHDHYIKGVDIINEYVKSKKSGSDDIILAYSNRSVQNINQQIYNIMPVKERWSPSLRQQIIPNGEKDIDSIVSINIPFGRVDVIQCDLQDDITGNFYPNPEFKKLCRLYNEFDEVKLGSFITEDGEAKTYLYVFGHQTFKDFNEKILQMALQSNKAIEEKFDYIPAQWVKLPENRYHPLTQARREAWGRVYTAKNTICVDYPYCITIHKSQGSQWTNCFIKYREIYEMFNGKKDDIMMFGRLAYVAMSRASEKVYTD